MTPQPAEDHDPFDLDFDAETDFAPAQGAQGPGAESPVEPAPNPEPAQDPWAPVTEASAEPMSDPFAGLPPISAAAREPAAPPLDEMEEDEPRATTPDPFAGLPASRDSDFHDDEGEPPDPFAGLGSPRTPMLVDDHLPAAPASNPIAEMLASAEAALGEHTVPRITIHAFWSRPEMSDLAQRASTDRRMERAKTVIHEGGLAGAVAFYQNQPTPSLIIVESLDPAQKLLGLLAQLAEVCDPGTKVIVVGAANDISLYRELMRRGVSEYLVPPLSPLQLIAAVTALYADPAQPFVGRQIAFCAAKGGAGASTLAHNVAYLISEKMGANTVLVDLDLAFGTAGLNFNQDPLHGIVDALTQPERLDPVLMERMMARCGDHLSLFAAPASIERDYEIPSETFDEVTQKIRATTPYVVLDLPHAWTPWKRRMLTTSDDVVVVAEPDLASLRNAKSIIDLVRSARPNDAPPRVVLNKVGVPMRPEIPVKDFGEAVGVPPSLVVGFDAKLFGQAANSGQMIAEVGPKSKSAEALDQLARMMISRRETATEAPAKQASLLDRLLRR